MNMKKIKLPVFIAVLTAIPLSVFSQDNEMLIKQYISQNKIREYKKSDLSNFAIENVDASKSMNGNVVKFHQMYNGLPVYNSAGTVLIKDSNIIYYVDNFVKNYKETVSNAPTVTKNAALQKIADDLGNSEVSQMPIMDLFQQGSNKKSVAKQRLVYAVDQDENLKLVYEYLLKEPHTSNVWNILVDANTGQIIMKTNITLSCNFTEDAYSHDYTSLRFPQNKEFYGNHKDTAGYSFLNADNASYNIFQLPIEAPTFGSRSTVNNPWFLNASPEGWHSDGTTHYTITRGNNVYAYEDVANADVPGFSPDGGVSRNFNFPFSTNGTPAANQNASITNLFYMNNKIHDIFYRVGFTEAARNFQQNNFGNGGIGDDSVMAEAQDGGGTDNANFAPYPEGDNPVMQMYLWTPVNKKFLYNAPATAISREPVIGKAEFGSPLNATGVTGDVKLSSVLNGCTALPAGDLTGKVGLVERGGCDFVVKVKNLQDAGATAAIVYNNTTNGNTLTNMGGVDATITISAVLITNTEGQYIKGQLTNTTVNVTLKDDPSSAVTPDGSFDNGIITHEYGHGISNRLTGTGSGCLNTSMDYEQMGEGWSDFFAIMLTNRPGDNASVPRGMGTYAKGQPVTGDGIRPAKYSPDFSINNFTYGNTNGMTGSHPIGFVWATMLWDLHWQYAAKYGYSSDVMANTTNGSTRVLQLVMDGLKLQACNPTFIDGRNAILQAEMATTGGVDKCMIWRTFAKRGLGVNALAGSKTNINDQTQDFTVPAECVLATDEVASVKNNISIYPNPAKNEFFINFPSNTLGKVSVEIYDMSGKLVSSENKISPDAKKAISTDRLINGTYMVKVKGIGIDAASKVIIKK